MKKNNDNRAIRVRFAPSPTGFLHVGSFRTALFNWFYARKNQGKFILRIEDTDRTRSSDEYLESLLADLRWMGLDWDEGPGTENKYGPYFQMQRLELYRKSVRCLLENDLAYLCYCTPEELKEEREKASESGKDFGYAGKCAQLDPVMRDSLENQGRTPCVRFRTPKTGTTIINDAIKGEVAFDNSLLDDFVIFKSDGIPTYNFAVVVDDHLMNITHVIRGDEHMSNTPKQVLLYHALNYDMPEFCHIPIILNPDRTKLSKRKGAVHLLEFRDKGYLKEALLNFIALLGWAPGENREIFSREELIQAFSIDGIPRHPAVFDENKLIWMNGVYMAKLPTEELAERLKPFLEKIGIDHRNKQESWFEKALPLYGERAKTLVELAENLEYYFRDITAYDPKGNKHLKYQFLAPALEELAERIENSDKFDENSLETLLREYAEEINQSAGKLIHAVRLAVTGKTASPPLFDVMVLLGKETTLKRLRNLAEHIRNLEKENIPLTVEKI